MAGTYLAGTAVKITETFTVSGTPTNPTTVTFTVEDPLLVSTNYVFGVAPEVTRPSTGVYVLQLPAQNTVGVYHYSVVGTGAVVAQSQGDFVIYGLGTEPGTQTGPCSPWADAADVAACLGIALDSSNNDTLAANAQAASQVLFELGGRQHAGLCSQTVSACKPECACWPFQNVAYAAGGSRGLYTGWSGVWGGGWYGGWWGEEDCGCGGIFKLKLAGVPVRSITQVTVNSVVLSPTAYRLDNHRYLTRIDGNFWPWCFTCADQTLSEITYLYGKEPPLVARQAAAQLAGEMYKACGGQECALPAGVTRTARQGIVIERNAFALWGQQGKIWRTGLALVDEYLQTYNSPGRIRRPVVWAPSRNRNYPNRVG